MCISEHAGIIQLCRMHVSFLVVSQLRCVLQVSEMRWLTNCNCKHIINFCYIFLLQSTHCCGCCVVVVVVVLVFVFVFDSTAKTVVHICYALVVSVESWFFDCLTKCRYILCVPVQCKEVCCLFILLYLFIYLFSILLLKYMLYIDFLCLILQYINVFFVWSLVSF